MQCLNCGRGLSPSALATGACPSCGFALPVAPPESVAAPVPALATTPALGDTQVQPVIAATPAPVEESSPVPPPEAITAAPAADAVAPAFMPLVAETPMPTMAAAPPPVVASVPEPLPPVVVSSPQTPWQAPAMPEMGNPAIPPVPPMMPPVQEFPAGYAPVAQPYPPGYVPNPQGYPPQMSYPYATGPMPGYPPEGYPPTGAPPAGYPTGAYPPAGYPTGAYPPGMYPTLAPVAKKGANGLAIGLSAGIFVVILALLGSLIFLGRSGVGPLASAVHPTPQPTATATVIPSPTPLAVPPAPAGFTTYKATDGSYGLNYPSQWLQTSQTTNGIALALFTSPDQLDNLITLPVSGIVPLNQYQQFGEGFARGSKATNIHFTATPTSVTIGANGWNKVTGTFTFQGLSYACVVLGAPRWDGTFFAIYLAPKSGFSAAEAANFTPMVQSVTFLKP